MLNIGLYIKKAIIVVLTTQTWDKSVKQNLTLIEDN